MRYLRDASSAMIDRVLAADTQNFVDLVHAAGLNPHCDFRALLLRGVDFNGSDLDAFDFTATRFLGCSFGGSAMGAARLDDVSFAQCDFAGVDPAELRRWTAPGAGRISLPIDAHDDARSYPPIADRPGRAGAAIRPGSSTSPAGAVTNDDLWAVAVCRFGLDAVPLATVSMEAMADFVGLLAGSLDEGAVVTHLGTGGSSIALGFRQASREIVQNVLRDMHVRALGWRRSVSREAPIEVLVGAAISRHEKDYGERLARLAEAAAAQANSKEPIVLIDADDETSSLDPWITREELERAFDEDQFELRYLPKISLRDVAVSGVETRLRWQHPARGWIGDDDFLIAAEEAGMLSRLTMWALTRMLADRAALSKLGDRIVFFLKISSELLRDAAFIERFCTLVRLSGASVGVEIGETAVLLDPDATLAILRTISEQGIRIAVDDYGTGISSLASLKQLPANELKIDRSLVTRLTSSRRDPLIVRSTIDLAHALDMVVTATGVETPATLALLAVMGCDQVQGFLISKPLAPADLADFLASPTLPESIRRLNADAGEEVYKRGVLGSFKAMWKGDAEG